MTAAAQKGGKNYFIKKYTNHLKPARNGIFDEKTIEVMEEEFKQFVKCRTRVNTALRSRCGAGGNLIVPCEEFIDGIHYCEVTEFVNGAIPDEELEAFIGSLSKSAKLMMMQTACGALSTVHGVGIVHSDLKLKNVMIAKNSAGNFVTKLIDFDSSYFLDDIRFFGGDDVYCSPELGLYSNAEEDEEKEEYKKLLSAKSDIFSLGVIFHFYLTGALPQPDVLSESLRKEKERREAAGKRVFFYPWNVLVRGGTLKIDDSIEPADLRALLYSMMSLMPEDRPTATQALQKLKMLRDDVIEEPWPEHNLALDSEKLAAGGVASLRKLAEGSAQKYEVIYKTGRNEKLTKEELVSKGYARTLVVKFCEPWPEHRVKWNEEKLRARGFVGSERREEGGVKGYALFRGDGSCSQFYRADTLTAIKYMIPLPPERALPAGPENPWPEDRFTFNMEKIRSRGYTKCVQQINNGVKGYCLVKPTGESRFVRSDSMVPLGFAIPV